MCSNEEVVIVASLTANQSKHSLGAKAKKPSIKSQLVSPYTVVWPTLDRKIENEIETELRSLLTMKNLRRPDRQPWQKVKKLNRSQRQAATQTLWDAKPAEEKNLRSQLILGVNGVTRNLENDKLRLIVVDRTAPKNLHCHLVVLAHTKGCAAVALPEAASILQECVGQKAAAFAFKKLCSGDCEDFTPHITSLADKCPTPTVPWEALSGQMESLKQFYSQTASCSENNSGQMDNESDENDELLETKPSSATMHQSTEPVQFGSDYLLASKCDIGKDGNEGKPLSVMKDYSHLYVMKGVTTGAGEGHGEGDLQGFITIESESDSEEVTYVMGSVVGKPQSKPRNSKRKAVKSEATLPPKKKKDHGQKQKSKSGYKRAAVGKMPCNPDRVSGRLK